MLLPWRMIALFVAFLIGVPLFARVGERRGQLEDRLKESGRALVVNDGDLLEYHAAHSPVGAYLELIPEVEYALYYKVTTDFIPTSKNLWEEAGQRSGRPVRKPEGWLFHVVYLNGVSVLELYQRSRKLSVVERNGILSLNQGQSKWESGRVPEKEEAALKPQILRQNHYLADFSVYGLIGGDSILLFDPRLDQMIHERQLAMDKELAPVSLDGF